MFDERDAAIDRAVREMLDIEPPADLRARVVGHIDGGGQRPASGIRWFVALSGAAAAVVLVVLLARHFEPPMQAPAVARAGDLRLPSQTGGQSSTGDARPSHERAAAGPESTTANQARVSRRAAATVAAALGPETSAPAIEPLNTINPIEVAPIAPRSIRPDPIGVRPLDAITEMQIAPLNPPDRRD